MQTWLSIQSADCCVSVLKAVVLYSSPGQTSLTAAAAFSSLPCGPFITSEAPTRQRWMEAVKGTAFFVFDIYRMMPEQRCEAFIIMTGMMC